MKGSLILGAAVLALSVSTVSAQGTKGLAGKWELDAAKTKAANVEGFGQGMILPSPVTLVLEGNVLTLTIESPKGARTTTYKLDGKEQPAPEGDGTVTGKREGARIILLTVRQRETGEFRSTAEYSQDGDALVVSTTAPPRGGGNPVTSTLIYKRAG